MRLFEWDPVKAETNVRKHGVSFEDAAKVFDDPFVNLVQDRIVGGERRWQALGVGASFTLLVVAHATWDDEQGTEVIRIISARRAEKHERRRYEEDR